MGTPELPRQKASRLIRPAPLLVTAFAALGLALAGCFDYEERLVILPGGEVNATVRYLVPDWIDALPDGDALLFPRKATDLSARFANGVALANNHPDQPPAGFTGKLADVSQLDTKLIKHRLRFTGGGRYEYAAEISAPPGFAMAISKEVEQQLSASPRILASRRESIRKTTLKQLGFRFQIGFPGEVLETDGQVFEGAVRWKIPLAEFFKHDRVTLHASGRLTLWQRFQRKFPFLAAKR